jgi:hypothetical protein
MVQYNLQSCAYDICTFLLSSRDLTEQIAQQEEAAKIVSNFERAASG